MQTACAPVAPTPLFLLCCRRCPGWYNYEELTVTKSLDALQISGESLADRVIEAGIDISAGGAVDLDGTVDLDSTATGAVCAWQFLKAPFS